MPAQLLPSSAAAFSARAPPNIVLNPKVDPFLTTVLKRVARRKPLNNVNQHLRILNDLLSSPTANWTLCHIFLQRAPLKELRTDDDPLVEALHNWQMVPIEAYVVHIDMVSQNEIAYKLTSDTIERLIVYHKNIHSVDAKDETADWSEKENQLKKLHEDFVQSINRFVYRTNSSALDGLEDNGSGELLLGRSDEVKCAILDMFRLLQPPPSHTVNIVRPTPVLPSSHGTQTWWPSMLPSTYFSRNDNDVVSSNVTQHDPWRIQPTNGVAAPVYTATTPAVDMWMDSDLSEFSDIQYPFVDDVMAVEMSPASSVSEYTCLDTPSPPQYYSLPNLNNILRSPSTSIDTMLHSCDAFTDESDFGGFTWDDPAFGYAMPFAI